jgi:hypothetical protein
LLEWDDQLDRNGLGRETMTDQDLWFEPVDLLSRCSLNEGLLWVWADRVPIDNVYREKNVFDSLQDWECERLNIPPVPKGVRRAAQYRTEKRPTKQELWEDDEGYPGISRSGRDGGS